MIGPEDWTPTKGADIPDGDNYLCAWINYLGNVNTGELERCCGGMWFRDGERFDCSVTHYRTVPKLEDETDIKLKQMSPDMLAALIAIKGMIAEKDVIHVQVVEAIVDKILDKVDSKLSPGTNKLDEPTKKDETFKPMEGNGPANIVTMVQEFTHRMRIAGRDTWEVFTNIEKQARLTLDYIHACDEARRIGKPLPMWHDIIADKGETDG